MVEQVDTPTFGAGIRKFPLKSAHVSFLSMIAIILLQIYQGIKKRQKK